MPIFERQSKSVLPRQWPRSDTPAPDAQHRLGVGDSAAPRIRERVTPPPRTETCETPHVLNGQYVEIYSGIFSQIQYYLEIPRPIQNESGFEDPRCLARVPRGVLRDERSG
jgi:hypothetical protein